MRVSVESYAYVLVKLARLRKHRITPREIPRLEELSTLADFMEIFSRYYPDVPLALPELTLVNFENVIWKDYFDAATRIINACPQTWQHVLTEYLLKYQIKNVKTIILGKIAELDPNLIRTYIQWEVEEIFHTDKVSELLLSQKGPREILYTLRDSRYARVLREGLAHYFNDKDPFYFQIYLDRYYYENLLTQEFHLPSEQAKMVKDFINFEAEFHNVRMIYRSLNNHIDSRIIREMLVPSSFYLTQEYFSQLIDTGETQAMVKKYLDLFAKSGRYKFLRENPVAKNFTYYLREFYFRLALQPIATDSELEDKTLYEILQFLRLKEYSIYHMTRILTRIMHQFQVKDEEVNE